MSVDLSPALQQLEALGTAFLRRLPLVLIGLLVVALFYAAGKLVRRGVRRLSARRHRHRNLGLVLGRLVQAGLVVLGVLVAAVIVFPAFKPGDLIQLLGISSVAIGFAFKDILQNFLAGVLLLLQEPFRVGDQIKVGEFEGTVEDIQTRATFLKTYDGRRIVIPNADLYTQKVTVNTAHAQLRLEYDVGIGYGDDLERARALILETLRTTEGVLPDPAPQALVMELADFAVNVRMLWWIRPPVRIEVLHGRDAVLTAVKARLQAEGIDLPFPTHQLLFHDQTEETDGDRRRQREGWPAGGGQVPRPRRQTAAPGADVPPAPPPPPARR